MAPVLRSLHATSMLSLSTDWLGTKRALISQSPELAALLPRLEEAHLALQRAQEANRSAENGDAARLTQQTQALDDRHDHAVRALYFAVSAALSFRLSEENADENEVSRLEALRDMILPDGLATTQASYETEAAMANRAREAIASDPEAQKLLREIKLFPKVTGLDLLSLWVDLGKSLGSMEFQRISAQGATGDANPVRARNAWLNVVASMLSVLPVIRSQEARDAILVPLEDACAHIPQPSPHTKTKASR